MEGRGIYGAALARQRDSHSSIRLLRALEAEQLQAPPGPPPHPEYHEDTAPPLPADWDAGDEGREVEFKRLNAADAPVRAIYKHVKVHGNAFLNSDGGSLVFGVSDRGKVCGLSLGAKDRDVLRTGIDQILTNFYPRVDPLLYHISFRRVLAAPKSPSKAGTVHTPTNAERFVLMLQLRRGIAPIYFLSTACDEAYIRGAGSSLTASRVAIFQRLCYGKPPPLTFAGLCAPISDTPPALLRAFASEWELILDALRESIAAPPIICIEGGPLSGKTSFLTKLIAELAPVWSEGLLEIDWAQDADAAAKWRKFEVSLQAPQTPLPASPKNDVSGTRYDARVTEANNALKKKEVPEPQQTSSFHVRRRIIALENVASLEAIRFLLLRRPRGSLLLITSHKRLALDIELGAVTITLGQWSVQRCAQALAAVAPRSSAAMITALAPCALESPGLLLGVAPLLTRCTQPAQIQLAANELVRDILARRFYAFTGLRRFIFSLALLALPVTVLEAALLWDVPAPVAAAILHVWTDHYVLLRAEPENRSVLPRHLVAAAATVVPNAADLLFVEGALRSKARLTPLAAAWALTLGKPALAWLAIARCARP